MLEVLECLFALRSAADAGREVPAGHVEDVYGYLDRAECIDLCRRLGVARTVRTRREAIAAVVRWVNTVPAARAAIAYQGPTMTTILAYVAYGCWVGMVLAAGRTRGGRRP